MMMFEYGIPRPGDQAKVDGEWKTIKSYSSDTVHFTDGSSASTSTVEEVRLNKR